MREGGRTPYRVGTGAPRSRGLHVGRSVVWSVDRCTRAGDYSARRDWVAHAAGSRRPVSCPARVRLYQVRPRDRGGCSGPSNGRRRRGLGASPFDQGARLTLGGFRFRQHLPGTDQVGRDRRGARGARARCGTRRRAGRRVSTHGNRRAERNLGRAGAIRRGARAGLGASAPRTGRRAAARASRGGRRPATGRAPRHPRASASQARKSRTSAIARPQSGQVTASRLRG